MGDENYFLICPMCVCVFVYLYIFMFCLITNKRSSGINWMMEKLFGRTLDCTESFRWGKDRTIIVQAHTRRNMGSEERGCCTGKGRSKIGFAQRWKKKTTTTKNNKWKIKDTKKSERKKRRMKRKTKRLLYVTYREQCVYRKSTCIPHGMRFNDGIERRAKKTPSSVHVDHSDLFPLLSLLPTITIYKMNRFLLHILSYCLATWRTLVYFNCKENKSQEKKMDKYG